MPSSRSCFLSAAILCWSLLSSREAEVSAGEANKGIPSPTLTLSIALLLRPSAKLRAALTGEPAPSRSCGGGEVEVAPMPLSDGGRGSGTCSAGSDTEAWATGASGSGTGSATVVGRTRVTGADAMEELEGKPLEATHSHRACAAPLGGRPRLTVGGAAHVAAMLSRMHR